MKKQLNIVIKSLYKWLCDSKISLNVTKTEVVLFHQNKKDLEYDLKLKLYGKYLKRSESVKYLGLQLDQNLSFSEHLNKLSAKLRNANGALFKIRQVATGSVLKSVLNSLFMSHISYACQTWGQNINLNSSRIFKLQNAALRIMTSSTLSTTILQSKTT